MKRALCLCLCLLMLAAVCAGCGGKEYPEDIVIPVYLSSEITTFDPAIAYLDEGAVEILGLIYEGLFKYDEKGKVVNDIASAYKIIEEPEDGFYAMTVDIKETSWSDGTLVRSDDFVYAIRRILEPDFYCEAASLLYDLKNARLVKSGDASIDDLGVYSVDTDTIEFVFENKIDYEQFREVLCSPALYPVREDNATKAEEWASCASTIATNGPFVIRAFEYGKSLILERNLYYMSTAESEEENVTKYVIPYRIVVNYRLNAKKNLESYDAGTLAYDSSLPIDSRADYATSVTTNDLLSTLTYFFNTTKAPFDNADVRKALSMAIDRNAIVEIVKFAKAADGLVPGGVFNTTSGTSFRESGEALVASTADIDGAKHLLKAAGVSGGSFKISIRDNDVEEAVAKYVAGEWKKLGFTVEVEILRPEKLGESETVYQNMYRDKFTDAYVSGNFDVISVDYQMLTKYAFNALAPFAKNFAGGAMDMTTGEYIVKSHITGYDSEEYNQIIEDAFLATDAAAKAELLHKAEKKLMEDMPVMPIIFYQDAYICKEDLKNFTVGSFGLKDFARAELDNYTSYVVAEE
ncbi:MAG: peptide ABC transporter substrate-binding protein [Ruminococcaceae bacterium]|nr:peptide ABC transporter substrate-binding protein [Oscillospiraceae bacterium]